MATDSNSIDVQKLVTGVAKLEIKVLTAGVEAMQVYLNQASQFSRLAAQTLQSVQDDKATLKETARKVSAFGREGAQAYAELAQRLTTRYFDEIDRLAEVTPTVVSSAAEAVSANVDRLAKVRRKARTTTVKAAPAKRRQAGARKR